MSKKEFSIDLGKYEDLDEYDINISRFKCEECGKESDLWNFIYEEGKYFCSFKCAIRYFSRELFNEEMKKN